MLAHFPVTPVYRCTTEPVCSGRLGGGSCNTCAPGFTAGADACTEPLRARRKDVSELLLKGRTHELDTLLRVVRRSSQGGDELNLLGQASHMAAIADGPFAAYNAGLDGVGYRNVHASFWFFHWHRAHLLAIEQAARGGAAAEGAAAGPDWAVPYWNITAPDAADVAARLLSVYAPERALRSNWSYAGPSESELLRSSLRTLVGAANLASLHSAPHEWFRLGGAQPLRSTNLDNPLFLPLHSYLDALFESWLRRRALDVGAAAAAAECATLDEPDGVACGVRCAGGAGGQRALPQRQPSDCLQFLPLWGLTHADMCRPLADWGVEYEGLMHEGAGRGAAHGRGGGVDGAHQHRQQRSPPSGEAEAGLAAQRWVREPRRRVMASVVQPGRVPSPRPAESNITARSAHLPPGLRLGFLSPSRRESLLLLPNSCDPPAGGDLAPPGVVGRLPPWLQLPVRGSSGWRCGGAAAAPPREPQRRPQQRPVLLRLTWSVASGGARFAFDARLSAHQHEHQSHHAEHGSGSAVGRDARCSTTGAAMLCAALCGNATATRHELQRRSIEFSLESAQASACIALEHGTSPEPLPLS